MPWVMTTDESAYSWPLVPFALLPIEKSRLKVLVTKYLPKPGMRKVASMKIDPVAILGICGPRIVISGMRAFYRKS